MMDVAQAISGRRSEREDADEAVDPDVIRADQFDGAAPKRKALDVRGLRPRRRKPHARGLRRDARLLPDRLCASLFQHAGRLGGSRSSGRAGSDRADRPRPSEEFGGGGSTSSAGNPMDRLKPYPRVRRRQPSQHVRANPLALPDLRAAGASPVGL